MRVIMNTSMQGLRQSYTKGQEAEFDAKQAVSLIDAGFAVAKDPEDEAAARAELGIEQPEPVTEPVQEPAQEPAQEPVTEPVQEPAQEPVTEPAQEPVTEPVQEPVTEPAQESATYVTEPARFADTPKKKKG